LNTCSGSTLQIFLETPRARVTLALSHYHESLSKAPSASAATIKEALQTASDLLSDLQVETYSSMERREKTEFILEQMRLLIAVARLKDAEVPAKEGKSALGGGEPEWTKAKVGGRKVNESFLKEKANEVRPFMELLCMTRNAYPHPGPQTQILRFNDPTSASSECIFGSGKTL